MSYVLGPLEGAQLKRYLRGLLRSGELDEAEARLGWRMLRTLRRLRQDRAWFRVVAQGEYLELQMHRRLDFFGGK